MSRHRYTHDDLFNAIKYFGEAIETDPGFADAYSCLAYCEFQGFNQMLPGYDDALERGAAIVKVRDFVKRNAVDQ